MSYARNYPPMNLMQNKEVITKLEDEQSCFSFHDEKSTTFDSSEPMICGTWSTRMKQLIASVLFTTILMTIGILTVIFTSLNTQKIRCSYTVISQNQDWIGADNAKLPIALGDFNNDNYIDIMVTQRDTNKIKIFLGYGNGIFPGKPIASAIASSLPYSIVVGYFNNDSALDFAVANYVQHSIGIFLGYGNGSFANESVYDIGASRPLSLLVYDLNNDTKLDIIVTNDGTSSFSVLFGYGNGTFTNPIMYSTGFDSFPHATAVGDFNNDARPDIVIANAGTHTIGIFFGNGNGTFSTQITYSLDDSAVALAVSDFNNDTRLDIVLVNYDSNNIKVFLGNGNGTFKNKGTYSTGLDSHPNSAVVYDFNKDGQLDIIVANSGTYNIHLFLGLGDGTFGNQQLYPIDIGLPQLIVADDLNNDGWIDIVVTIKSAYNVGIFLGGPDKNFTDIITYSTGGKSYPYAIAIGNFNNDTQLDIVVANSKSNELQIFLGRSEGGFITKFTYSTGVNSNPYSVTVGDFNNDNRLDIVAANHGTDNLFIIFGNGDGTFSNERLYETGWSSAPFSVAVGDFNKDNKMDIVVANSGMSNIGIFLALGDGAFSEQKKYSTGENSQPHCVKIADLNKDNKLDLIVANYGNNNVGVIFGNDDGTFSNFTTYSTGYNSNPYAIAVDDFNKDSQIDIAVVNYGTNELGVFLGFSDGTFSRQTIYSTGTKSMPTSIAIGDLNSDTQMDIIVTNYGNNNIGVFLGNKNGSFSGQTIYSTGYDSLPIFVALADFNDDEKLDIVVALSFYYSIGIFYGYYNSPFTIPTFYSSGSIFTPFALAVGDFDNNSRLDLVATTYDEGSITIYSNYADGIFESSALYYTGYMTGLYSVAVGDFNNDHRFDIVVANYDSNNIAFFLGFGNGSFRSAISYRTQVESGPSSVAVGDFNNDRQLDVVTANNVDNTVTVFLHKGFVTANGDDYTIGVVFGNENATFSNHTSLYTGYDFWPFSVAVADLNNDTTLDIAVANKYGFKIGIFLGYGDGIFANQTTYPTGSNSKQNMIVIDDFNKDSRLDIVVTNYGGYTIGLLLGNGDGTFSNHIEYSTGYFSWPWGIAITDFNRDTQLDIVVSNQYGFNIGVFLGTNDGRFFDQITYETGVKSLPIGIDVGDFNKDNRIDIIVANYGTDNVGMFYGNGNGTFSCQTTISTGPLSGPYWVVTSDFNKDGNLDFAAALSLADAVGVRLGDGNGLFSDLMLFETGTATYPWYLTVCDINLDDWLDIAVVLGDIGGIIILFGNPNKMFLVPMKYSTAPYSAPQALAVGDFNNDHLLDITVAYTKSDSISLFLGYGNGSFQDQITYSTGTNSHPWSLALGDLNNDTQLDIVVTNRNSNNIGVFLGLGNGTFKNLITYPTDILSNPVSAAIVDLNKDNKLDIIVANNHANSIGIFQGYGDGTFTSQTSYLTGYGSHPVWLAVGDFNGDEWIDIAVAALDTKNIKVLLKLCQ